MFRVGIFDQHFDTVCCPRGGYRPCEICDFTRSNYLIYIKSENMVKKSEKNRENYQQNENRKFHIVSIDTVAAPVSSLYNCV